MAGFGRLVIGSGGSENRGFLILAWSSVASSFTDQLTKQLNGKLLCKAKKPFPISSVLCIGLSV